MKIRNFTLKFFPNFTKELYYLCIGNRTKKENVFFRAACNNKMQQEHQTTMVVIPQKAWESLTNDMKEIKEFVKERETRENAEWMESAEARKMLGISPKTWQTYRDKRIIPFAQFGRKIMVKRSDIETFLESHFIEADNESA